MLYDDSLKILSFFRFVQSLPYAVAGTFVFQEREGDLKDGVPRQCPRTIVSPVGDETRDAGRDQAEPRVLKV